MTTYLALARLTVGGDAKQRDLELHEGIERLVEEMVSHNWTPDQIERAFEDACAGAEVQP